MKNRIHKYKAWDKVNKRWIKLAGFYIQSGEMLPWEWKKVDGKLKEWIYISDDCELVEFTGLLDKNGKEIYEGDILKHDLWGKTHIIWEHGMFRGVNGKDWNDMVDVTLADHQLKRCKVIGNIYENPDLLKPENQDNSEAVRATSEAREDSIEAKKEV